MSDLLFERLRRLRQRVARLRAAHALGWIVTVLLGGAIGVGLVDWLVHLDDPGVRLILGLGLLGAASFLAWLLLAPALLKSLSDVDLARQIERRNPGFRDSLSSTVQFLQERSDARLGSPALQQKVIAETLRRVKNVDLDDVVDTRSVVRASSCAMVTILVALTILVTNFTLATTALRRLALPFGAGDWPRRVELTLLTNRFEPARFDAVAPLRVAEGTTLELYVENQRGTLPDDLRLESAVESGAATTEKLRKTSLRDPRGKLREVGALTLTTIRSNLRFRAAGGDDDRMPFYQVEVVAPPVLEEFQVVVTPPKYTGRPVERLKSGVGHIEGLVGSVAEVTARSNRPLERVLLRVKDQLAASPELTDEGRGFRCRFTLNDAGAYSYWFELRDVEGFENPEAPRYEIRATADLVPEVSIEQPSTDVTVLPDARIPFRVVARDDLGLRSMRLVAKSGDRSDVEPTVAPLFDGANSPTQHAAPHTLSVRDFDPAPGRRILVHGEAADHFDLGPPHIGRSIARVLTVVTAQEKSAEIASRQGAMVDDLERALESETRAREQVGQLQLQLEKAGRLQPGDVDLLKRLELDQQQLASRLAGTVDSVESRSRELIREIDQNGLDDETMRSRLERLADEIATLRERNLPIIERNLTEARKSAATEARAEGMRDTLRAVGEQQDVVLDALRDQMKQLAEWRSRRDVSSELQDLIGGQKQLNTDTADAGRRTLGKPREQLTAQDQADLAKLSDRQSRQADRAAQLRAKVGELANDLSDSNPEAAAALREAQEELRRLAAAEKMREIAEQIEKNNVGQATTGQRQLTDELETLEKSLRERPENDAEELIKRMDRDEADLGSLAKRQEELQKKVEAADAIKDEGERKAELERLRKEQKKLRDDAADVLRRLKKRSGRGVEAARRAGERMEHAGAELEEGDADEADEAMQEAQDDLDQARREVARERREVQEKLARELLTKIADDLRAMIGRQQAVVAEIDRLDAEFQTRGNWSRAQLKSLVGLADVEKGLQAETDRLAEKIKGAEVFALALRGASRSMRTVSARLAERQADAETKRAAQAALKRFEELVAALKAEPNGEGGAPQQGGGEQPPPDKKNDDGPPTDGIPQLAQIKMLIALQRDLLERTAALHTLRGNDGALTPDQQAELDALALEQGQLADLARNLVRHFAPPDEAPKDAAPDENRPPQRKELQQP